MRVLYAGCNLFGQIVDSAKISFENFHEFDVEGLQELSIGHSVIVLRTEDEVFLQGHGLEPQKTHVVTKLTPPARVTKIVTSDTRVFLLDESGELFVLDFLDRTVHLQHKPNFVISSGDESNQIVKFAAGIAIKVAVSESGKVYNIPNELPFHNTKIVQVCAGNEHSLLLDGDGNVYSFGKGNRGQLGHCILDDEENPKLIEALAGLNIVKISTGNWHSCALSDEGDLYIWGWNSDGQLGLFDDDDEYGSESSTSSIRQDGGGDCRDDHPDNLSGEKKEKKAVNVVTLPSLLTVGNDEKVANVGCGSRHTVLVTDQNIVYGCGCNRFNQLALKDETAVYGITKIRELDADDKVREIICGPGATSVLIE